MASLSFESVAVPLHMDEHGAIRVGNTRVLVDLVIQEFQKGATPEGIVDSYEALSLPDVYAVLTYYLRDPDPIDEYLRERDEQARKIRAKIEAARPPRAGLRTMLIARLGGKTNQNASSDSRP